MKIKTFLLISGVSLLFFISCTGEEKIRSEKQPVRFITSVGGEEFNPVTRAVGNTWSANDAIGVFMKKTGEILTVQNILNGADNMKYITPGGNKYFSPADISQVIYFPDTEHVDFIAYYPFRDNINGYLYDIDLSDQSSQENIDLLYSNNAVNVNSSSVGVTEMSFTHQLTKLKFNIRTNDYISTLNGLTVTLSGAANRGSFNLATGELTVDKATINDFDAWLHINGNTATGEAIIFPVTDNNLVITFRLSGGQSFKHEFTATRFDKGASYTYDIILKGNSGTVEPNYGYFETPVKTSIDNTTFVLHNLPGRPGRNYSMLFDTKYKLAYWVAYPLHSYYLGDQSRTEAWQYDISIPHVYQPYLFRSFGIENTDRGHQIPSADRTYDYAENATTFYYSNMTAQHSRLNQVEWAKLETKVRNWSQSCDTLYVVTGAMITTKTDPEIVLVKDNEGKDIARPKYYYKALAQKVGTNYFTLAYKMDNEEPAYGFESYRLTVKQLEEETGFIFFPGVDAEAKNKIETDRWK